MKARRIEAPAFKPPFMKMIRTKIAELSFDEQDSILNIKILAGAEMNLQNIKLYAEAIKEITANRPYLALIDISRLFIIDEETLKFVSLPEKIENRLAAAYYNSNLANRFTVEVFKKFGKHSFPVKLFDTKEKAVQWLKKQI